MALLFTRPDGNPYGRRLGAHPVLAAAALLFATSVGSADLGTIESKRRIRVLVAVNEDPEIFSAGKSDSPGFEREILEGWARRLQVRVEVTTVRYHADLLSSLVEGRGDVAIGLARTARAREDVAFTNVLWPSTQVIVTRKPRVPPGNPDQLKNVVLGVVDGSTGARSVAEIGILATNVLRFPTRKHLFDGLRAGDLHAIVVPVWAFVEARRGDDALTAGFLLGGSAWAVDKDSVHLLHALNGHIDLARRSPAWAEVSSRYFGTEAVAFMGQARP